MKYVLKVYVIKHFFSRIIYDVFLTVRILLCILHVTNIFLFTNDLSTVIHFIFTRKLFRIVQCMGTKRKAVSLLKPHLMNYAKVIQRGAKSSTE